MTRIVKQLRELANLRQPSDTAQLCAEAAARIETLEAALEPFAARADFYTSYPPAHGGVGVPVAWKFLTAARDVVRNEAEA